MWVKRICEAGHQGRGGSVRGIVTSGAVLNVNGAVENRKPEQSIKQGYCKVDENETGGYWTLECFQFRI